MLIKNIRLLDREGTFDLRITEGRIAAMERNLPVEGEDVLEGNGALAIPPFVEPHIHLDTALTAGEPRWNESGTLFEGIQCWSERKAFLSHADVKKRARQILTWHAARGVQFVRTHVDVTDPALTALRALLEVREEMKELVTLQLVAFPQEGILSYPQGLALLEEALCLGADVVGAIPHFEFTREQGVASIHHAFDLAQKYQCLVDIHCDEIDDEQSRFLEVVAAEALRRQMGAQVTASHTTAMHSYNNAYTYKLFRLLKLSGIRFVANPLVNIHLQGRFDTYPKRRGITRVKELMEAGLTVAFGHDDVFDPWYPLGTGNMLEVLHMGMHVCQMMGIAELQQGLKLITEHGAQVLHLGASYGLHVGRPGNLVLLDAEDGYDALRRQAATLYSIRDGRVIARTTPAVSRVIAQNTEHLVDFKK